MWEARSGRAGAQSDWGHRETTNHYVKACYEGRPKQALHRIAATLRMLLNLRGRVVAAHGLAPR